MSDSDKKAEQQFDAVKYMRDQRKKISEKISEMSKAEIVEYFKRKRKGKEIKPCA